MKVVEKSSTKVTLTLFRLMQVVTNTNLTGLSSHGAITGNMSELFAVVALLLISALSGEMPFLAAPVAHGCAE